MSASERLSSKPPSFLHGSSIVARSNPRFLVAKAGRIETCGSVHQEQAGIRLGEPCGYCRASGCIPSRLLHVPRGLAEQN